MMELKRLGRGRYFASRRSCNRTMMELKPLCGARLTMAQMSCNRTMMELKRPIDRCTKEAVGRL